MQNHKMNPRWSLDVEGVNRGKVIVISLAVSMILTLSFIFARSLDVPTVYVSWVSGEVQKVCLANGTVLDTQDEIAQLLKGTYCTVYVR